MSLKDELLALTTCKDCGSKDVSMVPVPGGSIEFLCECGAIWWFEPTQL